MVRKFVTFQETLACLDTTELNPLLQSAYLDFITSTYVDFNAEESGVDIDNMWHSYVSSKKLLQQFHSFHLKEWKNICPNPKKAANIAEIFKTVPDPKEMEVLRDAVLKFLIKNKVLLFFVHVWPR